MNRPVYELAEIIRTHKSSFINKCNPLFHHLRTLYAIEICRTSALGFHVDKCNSCDHLRISYNSCRNRHCPKCQSTNREAWIEARKNDLLPVKYFHTVFTIPHELNPYCHKHPKEMYNILFEASSQTILHLGLDPKLLGAKMGMISVLHTWGQNISLHPHIHMIVPAGGIGEDDHWISLKGQGKFLFDFKVMSSVFKGKFMEKFMAFLVSINQPINVPFRRELYNKRWNVDARQPFLGPAQVIEYLGRYTHKIAISNHRIKKVEDGMISFSYKDYADKGKQKVMTLDATEFLRRFCLHILPPKFMKIRHYGILANRNKQRLHKQQMKMGVPFVKKEKQNWKEIARQNLNFDPDACPCCKTGKMIRIMSFDANPPPAALALLKIILQNQVKK
ncbi:MAG TPA: IS91 family transposase [Flavitalea sp.]|nr:IS91 family transposase [Flavitalea sp.]